MRHFGLRLVALASHLHGNVESLLNRAWWALQSDEDREAARLYPEG